ncbi:unnamed protein product [Effrenium voratum]|nr:unnamed protein product [Effrenium voratum]
MSSSMLWSALLAICPLASANFMRSHHVLKAAEFQPELRVCNAYAGGSFNVVKAGNVLTDEPLAYMHCRQFEGGLKAGDNLEFKQGNKTAGVFTVWSLPQHDAILMLIAHRSQDPGEALTFMSHVFAPSDTAQVAVIDTYNGAPSNISIKEADKSEPLSFGTVTGISPGSYDIVLDAGKEHPSCSFKAKKKECYVVLRTGWKCRQQNCSFPQQVLVYPEDSSSSFAGLSLALAAVLALLW